MRSQTHSSITVAAAALLDRCGMRAQPSATPHTSFVLELADDVAAAAVAADAWLRVEVLCPYPKAREIERDSPAGLVARNAALAAGAKLVLSRDRGIAAAAHRGSRPSADGLELRLCADIPLGDDEPSAQRLRETCGALLRAATSASGTPASIESSAAVDVTQAEQLAQAIADAGWAVTRRPDGRLAVELEVPGSYCQTSIAAASDGRVSLSADVARLTDATAAECETAICLLLLRVAGAVRMVRAARRGDAQGSDAGFEILFASRPTAAEINHALAALSIACRAAQREAALLASNVSIARAYLAHSPSSETSR